MEPSSTFNYDWDTIKQPSIIKTLEQLEERQKVLFDMGNVNTPEYENLQKELHFVENANEIEEAVKRLNEAETKLLSEKDQFNKKYDEILKSQPQKIFICEDSDKKVIGLWEHLLKLYGLTDVKVMTSEGCTSKFIEIWGRYQKKLSNNAYNPKLFRQIDRDGLTNDQIDYIGKELFSKESDGLDYKFDFIPVNEIENFAVLSHEEFTEEYWKNNRIYLEDKFSECAHSTCLRFISIFKNQKLFNVHGDSTVIQPMKEFARSNWKKYFPGKEICAKLPNIHPITIIQSKKKEDLPSDLKQFMANVANFFNPK